MKTLTHIREKIVLSFLILLLPLLVLMLTSCTKDNYNPNPNPNLDYRGTVSDIEGNIYQTIILNDQEWMAENFRVTKYNDGTAIEFPGMDTLLWQTNTTGAYAFVDHKESKKDLYGLLYNWHSINNSKGICPSGWRVPSSQDWDKMVKYLVSEYKLTNDISDINAVGNKLKSCRMVDSPLGEECNTNIHPRWEFNEVHIGTNDFGFSALPAGNRGICGGVGSMGLYGFWWCHDREDIHEDARYRYINFDQSKVFGARKYQKNYGLSVRCIKE